MSDDERVGLYVSLKSLDRLTVLLEGKGIEIPPVFSGLLDQAWRWLAEGKKVTLKGVEKTMRSTVVDEQVARVDSILLNMYLYALSDLAQYFKEGEFESLECVEAAVIDFYDFYVAQMHLDNIGGAGAVVFSSAQETAVKEDPIFASELSMLSDDRAFAKNQVDWSGIESTR
ncbi:MULTISPECIES: hypothetical protein [Pseudomonas]|uniref:hypothetical protein n=1 Tax=Pseudomonas TaxID=286 RepID=UPI002B410BCE|nr:hypothetical protein [Pseudomonas sichuanensis]